jgi:hypothetical protein
MHLDQNPGDKPSKDRAMATKVPRFHFAHTLFIPASACTFPRFPTLLCSKPQTDNKPASIGSAKVKISWHLLFFRLHHQAGSSRDITLAWPCRRNGSEAHRMPYEAECPGGPMVPTDCQLQLRCHLANEMWQAAAPKYFTTEPEHHPERHLDE